jgi:hypothetical protein
MLPMSVIRPRLMLNAEPILAFFRIWARLLAMAYDAEIRQGILSLFWYGRGWASVALMARQSGAKVIAVDLHDSV